MAIGETRLRVKVDDADGAKRLADSLLQAHPKPAPAVAAQLAGLAALTGRSQLTADLLQRSAPVDSPTTNTAEVITGD